MRQLNRKLLLVEMDDGTFYNLECTGCGNKQYGILTAFLLCTYCNRQGSGYHSEYWKMADAGSDTPLQVMRHYQCVSCNKSVEGPHQFLYSCCKSSNLGHSDYWRILNDRSVRAPNVYNAYNLRKERAGLSLEKKAHKIDEFFNNKCNDIGGLEKLINSLNIKHYIAKKTAMTNPKRKT